MDKTILLLLLQFLIITSISYTQSDSIKSLMLENDYKKVIQIMEKKVKDNDTLTFYEYNSLAKAYMGVMNYSKAEKYFKRAKLLNPKNIANIIDLGNTQNLLGNKLLAKSNFEEVLNIDSNNTIAKIKLSGILIELGKYGKAIDIYHNLIKEDSTNSQFNYLLGLCYYKLKEYENAQVFLNTAIEYKNYNPKIFLILGKIYSKEENYEMAIKTLQNGITQQPDNNELNRMLADIYFKTKNYNSAILKYLFCISNGDSSAVNYQKLGMAYYYQSFTYTYKKPEMRELKINEAIQSFQKCLDIENDNPVTYLYLGLCYKEIHHYENSIKYLEESLNYVFPEYMDQIYSNLGAGYSYKQNYVEAIKVYKEALRYNPSRKELYFYLANAYDYWYRDKSVPVLYYKKFIDEAVDPDENLVGYSLNRIRSLTREKKFWNMGNKNGKTNSN